MHAAGDEFLATSGFAADENGGMRGSHFRHQSLYRLHRRVFADELYAGRSLFDTFFIGVELAHIVATFEQPLK